MNNRDYAKVVLLDNGVPNMERIQAICTMVEDKFRDTFGKEAWVKHPVLPTAKMSNLIAKWVENEYASLCPSPEFKEKYTLHMNFEESYEGLRGIVKWRTKNKLFASWRFAGDSFVVMNSTLDLVDTFHAQPITRELDFYNLQGTIEPITEADWSFHSTD